MAKKKMSDPINLNLYLDSIFPRKYRLVRWACYSILWAVLFIVVFGGNYVINIIQRTNPLSVWGYLLKNTYLIIVPMVLIFYFIVGKMNFWGWLLAFVSFPFRIIIWLFLMIIIKAFSFVLRFISGTINYNNSFKYKVLLVMLFIISCLVIFKCTMSFLIISSMVLLSGILIVHFIGIFLTLPIPIDFFNKIPGLIFKVWDWLKKDTLGDIDIWEKMKPDDPGYSQKGEKIINNLVLYNRFFRKTAKYLSSARGNLIIVSYFAVKVLFCFFLTVFIFAMEYYAILKLAPEAIHGFTGPNIYNCLYFSFSTITTTTFGDIYPIGGLGKWAVVLEVFCGIIIGIMLFFIFTTITMNRYKEDLEKFTIRLLQEEKDLREIILLKFNKNLKEIISELLPKVKPEIEKSISNEKLSIYVLEFFKLDDDELT